MCGSSLSEQRRTSVGDTSCLPHRSCAGPTDGGTEITQVCALEPLCQRKGQLRGSAGVVEGIVVGERVDAELRGDQG